MDYNLLKTFAKVAELGSFTQAAKILNQPKSRVSRAITRLENELGVELIRRTTRKSALTSSGQEFYSNITPHLNEINNELIRISDKQEEMTGTIRITTSESFAQNAIAEIISIYNSKYPQVEFEMIITNDYLDLVKENIDLAFRAGKLKDSTLIQKKFMQTNFILVCSKSYIDKYSLITSFADFQSHKYLSFRPMESQLMAKVKNIKSVLRTDSLTMLLKMALKGDGVTILPDFICQYYIDSKELVRVLPSWSSRPETSHILYPPTKKLSKKVKAFIEVAQSIYN